MPSNCLLNDVVASSLVIEHVSADVIDYL